VTRLALETDHIAHDQEILLAASALALVATSTSAAVVLGGMANVATDGAPAGQRARAPVVPRRALMSSGGRSSALRPRTTLPRPNWPKYIAIN